MIRLQRERLLALVAIYESAGLQSVLDIFEGIVTESENALIGENPANTESVRALHAIAHAQRAMLIRTAQQIDYLVAEFRGGESTSSIEARFTNPYPTAGLAEKAISHD